MTTTINGRGPQFGPQFSNPFERQRSVDKVPTLSAAQLQPLLTNDSISNDLSSTGNTNGAGWRTRAASLFQSVSSNSSSSSNISDRNAVQLKDRTPSIAPRRPSYVPKYAARAHLSSVSGKMTISSDVEIDAQLRRESRMMSVISADSMSEASGSSSSGRKPS